MNYSITTLILFFVFCIGTLHPAGENPPSAAELKNAFTSKYAFLATEGMSIDLTRDLINGSAPDNGPSEIQVRTLQEFIDAKRGEVQGALARYNAELKALDDARRYDDMDSVRQRHAKSEEDMQTVENLDALLSKYAIHHGLES